MTILSFMSFYQMAAVFRICSLLMALLFAVSASFQFNDPDWFFWFPLYTCGCVVHLARGLRFCRCPKIITAAAKCSFWLGIYLFIKVALEGFGNNGGISVLWSLDMRERVVREKLGSVLVVGSVYAHLKLKTPLPRHHRANGQDAEAAAKLADYGMLTLVVVGYGLSVLFYLCHQQEMRF